MRIATLVLAALAFAAGLILDTGALLTLLGGLLSRHAVTVVAATLLAVAVAVGWRRLGGRTGSKPRGRVARTRRPAGPRRQRANGGRGRGRPAKSARAK